MSEGVNRIPQLYDELVILKIILPIDSLPQRSILGRWGYRSTLAASVSLLLCQDMAENGRR
jgi:hypothetical protein